MSYKIRKLNTLTDGQFESEFEKLVHSYSIGASSLLKKKTDGSIWLHASDSYVVSYFKRLTQNIFDIKDVINSVFLLGDEEDPDSRDLILNVDLIKDQYDDLFFSSVAASDCDVKAACKTLCEMNDNPPKIDKLSPLSFKKIVQAIKAGDTLTVKYHGSKVSGTVIDLRFESSPNISFYKVILSVTTYISGKFESAKIQYRIYEFDGEKTLDDLNVYFIGDDDKKAISGQNKHCISMIKKGYVQFDGEVLTASFFGLDEVFHSGRLVVDPESHYKIDTSTFNDYKDALGIHTVGDIHDYSENEYWSFIPFVTAYSLGSKEWVLIDANKAENIQFDDNAFDMLVMEDSRKEMLLALVETDASHDYDLISGKGGGSVILLHGEPGLGKTLSAEAVAELKRQPLYKVSMSEIGTDVAHMESQLKRIIDLSERWNAIILIDEADVFLEARSNDDIARNTMVSVFLRLLEYYKGIIFLTTNRVKQFDKAFHSRISMAFGFKNMTEVDRIKIWESLIQKAKEKGLEVGNIDIPSLSCFKINGREIKNAINTATLIAKHRKVLLTTEHLEMVLEMKKNFMAEVSK